MSDPDWREDTDWQRLGAVVERIKRDVEAAYYDGREADAENAHDDLMDAGWRLDRAKRFRSGK